MPPRVMVVDDDTIREIAQLSLSAVGGWDTVTARSGEEALSKVSTERLDAILLDVVANALADLFERARASFLVRADTIEGAAAALLEGGLSEPMRAEAEREAHKLAGAAGTFGLHRASDLARELELLLSDPHAHTVAASHALELVEALGRELRDGGRTETGAG